MFYPSRQTRRFRPSYCFFVFISHIHSRSSEELPNAHFGNITALQWRHDGCNGIWKHRCHDFLLKRLFRCRSKRISQFRVIGFCEGNPPVTSGFPLKRASNTEHVSLWWRHPDRCRSKNELRWRIARFVVRVVALGWHILFLRSTLYRPVSVVTYFFPAFFVYCLF